MDMLDRSRKRPAYVNTRAGSGAAGTSGHAKDDAEETPKKNAAAVELGRLGGLKGGKARAAKLSARRRSEIARKAARARWKT